MIDNTHRGEWDIEALLSSFSDRFTVGRHVLVCGDTTKPKTYELLLSGIQADLLVAEPPYTITYEGGTKEALTFINQSMSDDESFEFLFDFFHPWHPMSKK